MNLTEPLRGILVGPKYVEEKINSWKRTPAIKKVNELIYALPASRDQREVCERLFINDEPVINLFGPPGNSVLCALYAF